MAAGEREYLARVEVEERRVGDGANGVGALWAFETEARALPAGYEDGGDMARRKLRLAARHCGVALCGILQFDRRGRLDRRRGRRRGGGAARRQYALHAGECVEVQ